MFTTPCFIKKNTPELRKKLEELGYEYHGQDTSYGTPCNLYCSFGSYFELSGTSMPSRFESVIDCGTNEELFLALASLRDDSNENQWFIAQDTMWDENYNGEITVYYEEGEWLLWDYYSFMEDMPSDFRKATVNEIIEHFLK